MAIPLLRFFFRTANKNPACRILRLRRVALATLFHSAAVRSLAERFLCHRTKFPMTQKRAQNRPLRFCAPVELPERFPPLWEVAPSVVGRCRPAFSERRPINFFGVYIMSTEQVPNFCSEPESPEDMRAFSKERAESCGDSAPERIWRLPSGSPARMQTPF